MNVSIEDEKFMQVAINKAKESNSTSYASVIVKNGEIISLECNSVKIANDPTSHGEINAIRQACSKLNTRDLAGCVLYTTCEPCSMCFSAAWWANISKIVYGVKISDIINIGKRQINISCDYINKHSGEKIEIIGGVCRKECLKLFTKLKI